MLIGELLRGNMESGDNLLSYYIYWGMQQGLPDTATFKELQALDTDWQEVKRMERENVLGIYPIKLYSSNTSDGFHLSLARSAQEAKQCIKEYTKLFNPNVIEVPNGMYNTLFFPTINRRLGVDELAKDCTESAYYVGCYVKHDDACYRGNKAEYLKKIAIRDADEQLVIKLAGMEVDGLIDGDAVQVALDSIRKGVLT